MFNIINLIFGICSLIGLVVTLITFNVTIQQLNKINDPSAIYETLSQICLILGSSIIALIVVFIIQSTISARHVFKLNNDLGVLPKEYDNLISNYNHKILSIKEITYHFHDIAHYLRYMTIILDRARYDLENQKRQLQQPDIDEISYKFEFFMITKVLTSISQVMKTLTGDTCAACIKITKNNKLKTLYRDSTSYKRRKKSDWRPNGKPFIYNMNDNTAFATIASPSTQDTYYICDNLNNLKEHYRNCNSTRNELYNATIVVPIQANLSGTSYIEEMDILGFLCCDNMEGGFESLEIKDFLASIGDQLYNILVLYDNFYQGTITRGLTNVRLQTYDNWDESR